MVGVRLVVERRDLDVAGRPVEPDCLAEAPVGLQPGGGGSVLPGPRLELGQEATADAEPPGGGGDPHPLELGRAGPVELHGAGAQGLTTDAGQQQQPGGLDQVVDGCGDAPAGVEAAVEPAVELVEIGLQAALRVRAGGVLGCDHHLLLHRQLLVGCAHVRPR
jgi:hypothetical protein